ncbi:hypothetical protein T439DRAFT_382098 [Meredithblackwellia eburnea MCA 4105]
MPGIQQQQAPQKEVVEDLPGIANHVKLLFRREVSSFLKTAPANVNGADDIECLAAIERIDNLGFQESVGLFKCGEQSWVTRTEGDRVYFPRVGRVKRVRENEASGEAGFVGEGAVQQDEGVAGRVKRARGKKAARAPMDEEEAQDQAGAAVAPGPVTPDMGRQQPRTGRAPRAPKKPVHPVIPEDFVVGEGPDGGSPVETDAAMRKRVKEALGRGSRRSERIIVKAEENDDLLSLCGKVSGLDVKSSIDTESAYARSRAGSPAPIASGSGIRHN